MENTLDDSRGQTVKMDYEVKYLKEKEVAWLRKKETKDTEFIELKSRL